MKLTADKLNELINRINDGDFENSLNKKDTLISQVSKLVVALQEIPQKQISGDLSRVKDQLFNRIKNYEIKDRRFGFVLQAMPRIFKVSSVAVASLLLVVSLTVGTVVSANQSVPGDAIYPLKKVVENLQLKIARDDNQRANLQLRFAYNRLEELQSVIDKKDEGRITKQEAETLMVKTVTEISDNTKAIAKSNLTKTNIVAKLNDLSAKLKTASFENEGQVRIELQQAIAETKISKEQAIKNLERAGMKVEDELILNDEVSDQVSISGKITIVSELYITVGSTKIYLQKDTKYFGGIAKDLAVDKSVDIITEIRENKSYALQIVINQVDKGEVKGETTIDTSNTNNADSNSGVIRIEETDTTVESTESK